MVFFSHFGVKSYNVLINILIFYNKKPKKNQKIISYITKTNIYYGWW